MSSIIRGTPWKSYLSADEKLSCVERCVEHLQANVTGKVSAAELLEVLQRAADMEVHLKNYLEAAFNVRK